MNLTDAQLSLIVQVIRKHEQEKLHAKFCSNKKGPALKRGEWCWTEIRQPEFSSRYEDSQQASIVSVQSSFQLPTS
jgi:hypothetical protein